MSTIIPSDSAGFEKKSYNESNDMRIGYARVSTSEQNLDLQRAALKQAGCEKIVEDDGLSGANRKRPGLERAIQLTKAGDTLVVWRLDRLGRSLVDLIDILGALAERGAEFHSLAEAIDTNSSGGRLVFHMMGALAEFERNLISERTRAGMAVAKNAGKPIGRPRILTDHQIADAEQRIEKNDQSLTDIADELGVHRRTLKRALRRSKGGCPPIT
ncbi:recombinase family protein [Shimia sp. MMG029]|uniref:recombinase family protein n=1 Tax=Shimia sp. MMG029 TaxID=3021978 RepID=UPI0022FF2022|nr:recombinase family protein [Shimia sp. MMG029]MDA5555791.1 recombinase family protein [Shimia sp. MMG029]